MLRSDWRTIRTINVRIASLFGRGYRDRRSALAIGNPAFEGDRIHMVVRLDEGQHGPRPRPQRGKLGIRRFFWRDCSEKELGNRFYGLMLSETMEILLSNMNGDVFFFYFVFASGSYIGVPAKVRPLLPPYLGYS